MGQWARSSHVRRVGEAKLITNLIDRLANSWINKRIDQETKKIKSPQFRRAEINKDGFFAEWIGPEIAFLADQASDMLLKADAKNYVQFEMIGKNFRRLIVTVQWADGESPAEQNARLRQEIEKLKEKQC